MSDDPRSNRARRDTIEHWTVTADRLEVAWGDGHESRYAFPWLRDWCACGECTNRQLVDSEAMLDLAPDCAPRTVETAGDGALRVTWAPDGHQSVYAARWLRAHCPAPAAGPHGRSGAALAGALPVVDYGAVRGGDAGQLDLLETVRDRGFALIHGVPTVPDEVERIASYLGYVAGGWRYAAQPEDISVALVRGSGAEGADAIGCDADGDGGAPLMDHERYQRTLLAPHTDFSFTSWPTGLFVFHCLSPSADDGGVSILVDGFHVADRLRREDPAAFELLSTLRQPFCGYGGVKFDWRAAGRVIALDHGGRVTGIRFAMASRAPLAIPGEQIEPYYRATRAMLRLVLDPECQLRLPLAAGDCLVLDNHRMLHGRTAMDPAAGRARRFRRFDVERDAAQTRMRQLARRLGRAVAPLPAGAHG